LKRLIIVDISSFIFRAFFAIRPLHAPDGTPVNAVQGVLSMLLRILSKNKPTHLFIAKDTSGGSFRNEIYSEYKANRGEPPEELVPQFSLIRDLVDKLGIPNLAHERYEADDIIGSAVRQWEQDFDEVLIASGDKDLMQFVGGKVKMLDTMKDVLYDEAAVKEKMGVPPSQIVDFLSIVGDSSDNIPGLPGIGPKGAQKLLEDWGTLENCIAHKSELTGKKVIEAFEHHLDKAILSKKLVTIETGIDLETTADQIAYELRPSEELIHFLRDLGFKRDVAKLEEMAKAQGSSKVKVGEEQPAGKDVAATAKEIVAAVKSKTTPGLHIVYGVGHPGERAVLALAVCCERGSSHVAVGEEAIAAMNDLTSRKDICLSSFYPKDHVTHGIWHNHQHQASLLDLVQMHFVLDAEASHDPGYISKEFLGLEFERTDKAVKDPSNLLPEELISFAGERARAAFVLAPMLTEALKEAELLHVYESLDAPLIPVIAQMEREGVLLDRDYFRELESELDKSLGKIEATIHEHVGDKVNLNSPKQVGEALFVTLGLPVIKSTKTGPSTDSEVLEELDARGDSPVPGLMLQHRELGKLLSTYVRALPELADQKTNRLHTHYNQHIAATGRLSSTNPNLQNIPIRTELGRKVRKGFVATPGHVLLGADYSQVELRLLAHFSGDETMLQAFNNGEDIHRQTASEVMGIALADVTSEDRSRAKAVNFGLMYGQSSFGLAAQLKISRKDAKEYITRYFERFSSVKLYLDTLKESAEKTGYAETFFGRKRFLRDIQSQNRTMKAMAERVAINSPIQGTAADIIKKAMVTIHGEIEQKSLKSKMLLQVHDELIFEVPENELEIMKSIVRKGMETVVELKVPLHVDMGSAKNWYDLK
jgi:DNA polymerase-1